MAAWLLSWLAMNVSMYQAASAMDANARWQDVISQNLAASSVPGYRKIEMSMGAVEGGKLTMGSGNDTQPFQLPSERVGANFRAGEFRQTGVNTDVAIEGDGFFEIQLPGGDTGYTRDGQFSVSADGMLVTKEGHPVMGQGGPIRLNPQNGAPVSISTGGDVSQGEQVLGRLQVVEFNDRQLLTRASGGLFFANDINIVPDVLDEPRVRSGMLEGANTTPMMEMANMITAMRMFQLNDQMMEMADQRVGKVIQELSATH